MKRLNLKVANPFNIKNFKFGETGTDKVLNFLTSFADIVTTDNL